MNGDSPLAARKKTNRSPKSHREQKQKTIGYIS